MGFPSTSGSLSHVHKSVIASVCMPHTHFSQHIAVIIIHRATSLSSKLDASRCRRAQPASEMGVQPSAAAARPPRCREIHVSPATREQAMLMRALVLSSSEGSRDRQGVGARVQAAYRCFDRTEKDSDRAHSRGLTRRKSRPVPCRRLLSASPQMPDSMEVRPSLFDRFSGSTNRRLRAW